MLYFQQKYNLSQINVLLSSTINRNLRKNKLQWDMLSQSSVYVFG